MAMLEVAPELWVTEGSPKGGTCDDVAAPWTPWPTRLVRGDTRERDDSCDALLLPSRIGLPVGACDDGSCTARGWAVAAEVPICGGGWFKGRVVRVISTT